MNRHFNDIPNIHYANLARWLQHILVVANEEQPSSSSQGEHNTSELSFEQIYHPEFYQQLPDFIMALLNNDPQATTRYGALLYHLIGCRTCRTAYVELYEPMQAAMQVQVEHLMTGEITRPLGDIPVPILVLLCQLFISQAEAALLQGRREHTDQDDAARSLLRQAMKIATQIGQSGMRNRALKDLVRVATLFEGPTAPHEQEPPILSYTPSPVGAGGPRKGRKVRRAEMLERPPGIAPEESVIYLQANQLEGFILQHEHILQLQLVNLDTTLRGRYLNVSIPLGSLIEPIRWIGSNPRAIRSTIRVDEHGMLTMPLGSTEMRLNNPEERDLLEVMFSLLEVRPVNESAS